jgi:soluble lytic murein transglycosylase
MEEGIFVERNEFHQQMRLRKSAAHRRDCALALAVLVVIAAFGVYFLSQTRVTQRSYIYPYPYRDIVETYAEAYQVDSFLVAAVIMSESKFKNDVHSHRGAIGLMQLMPDTAAWIADQLGDGNFDIERLHEPDMNIRYGTWYLKSLEDEFDGNTILALAAYNAGRGNVKEWMHKNGWTTSGFHDVAAIPYGETRFYVDSVLKNQKKYQELYK